MLLDKFEEKLTFWIQHPANRLFLSKHKKNSTFREMRGLLMLQDDMVALR